MKDSIKEVISCWMLCLVTYGLLLHRMLREENLEMIIDIGLRCFILPMIYFSKYSKDQIFIFVCWMS